MANFEIDEEVLVAFLKGELDAAQAAAVEAWYDRSAANRRMLGQVYYILYNFFRRFLFSCLPLA